METCEYKFDFDIKHIIFWQNLYFRANVKMSTNDETKSNQTNFPVNEINPIKVKLPTFWNNAPETWFIQAEAEFTLSRITSDLSKYNYVVRALPQDIAESITDLLKEHPTVNAYSQIKERLIERHSLSTEARIKKLVSDEMIGDKKPSEFYRKLLDLAGDCGTVGEELVKKLWLNRLPNVISIALIPQSKENIQSLIKIADQIHEAVQGSSLSAIKVNNSPNYFQPNYQVNPQQNFSTQFHTVSQDQNPLSIESLQAEITELKRVISQFHNNDRGRRQTRFRSRSPAANRERSKSRSSYNPSGTHCWYHFRFGNKATKCNKPCSFVIRKPQTNCQQNPGN